MRAVHLKIAIALLLLSVGRAAAGDAADSPIKIQSELRNLQVHDEAGHPTTLHKLILLLINTGTEPVTVVTDKLDRSTEKNDDGSMTITLGLNSTVKKDGHLIVPSLSKLAPVTLQPGEAASISTDSIDLSEYKGEKLNVTYEVSDFWGKRLSLWAGSATSETTVK